MKIILTIARWGLADVAALGRHTPGPAFPFEPRKGYHRGGVIPSEMWVLSPPAATNQTAPLSMFDPNDGPERTRSEVQKPLSDITIGL